MKEIVKKVGFLEPVDIDAITIRPDHYFPNAYIIDLPLDSAPNHVWQDIFERQWKSSRHLWDRKIFVIGDRLRLVTAPDEIEDKLEWVKQIVERTNQRIDEYNREAEARETQMKEQMKKQMLEEQKTNVEIIRNILRRSVYGSLR